MAESVAKAKSELRVLLEALGHTFIDRPYRKPVADQPCWRLECESCGKDWFLRFQKNPSARGDRNVASFPQLGERCQKQQKAAGG